MAVKCNLCLVLVAIPKHGRTSTALIHNVNIIDASDLLSGRLFKAEAVTFFILNGQ